MLQSRVLACATSLLMLSACSVDLGGSLGLGSSGGNGARTVALVVGDEPFAVRTGAAILSQGGSAVDAVTATYFALAVTYPVAAGLGGGGICIVHDATTGQNEEFDFLARDASGGGAYGVPGNVRGFALMQSLYGAIPWQRDVSPGEGYAATGFPISRALSLQLAQTQDAIHADAGLAAEFIDEGGKAKPEGTVVSSPQLAQTLAAVRVRGVEGFYKGEIGARIIAFSQSQGGGIAVADLGANTATEGAPQAVRMSNAFVLLPSQRTGAGAFAGALFDNLNRAQSTNAGAGDLQASIVYAVKQALGKFGVTNVPGNLGATGFAAVDARGEAAACAVTMNGPFGSARSATGTGVVLARAPGSGPQGAASAFLTPVIALEGEGGSVSLAGAGAGGPNGAAAIGYALARVGKGETPTSSADIRSTGVANDTVNVIACQNAMCIALPDPAGHGSGAAGDSAQ
jgi:gamma-glutamyltranspeptidase / glutathione hydrolase